MKLCFVCSPKAVAQAARRELRARYGQASPHEADYLVAVGGDGTVLRALHMSLVHGRQPVFGMRTPGSVGALAGAYSAANLPQRLVHARGVPLHPLKAEVRTEERSDQTVLAINEVVFSRQRLQAAHVRVIADGCPHPLVIGDGLIVSTAIGSGGYNASAGGPLLSHVARRLALTAIALHPSSRWGNRLVAEDALIEIEIIHPEFRPVRLETNSTELSNELGARVTSCSDLQLTLLFDKLAC